MRPFYFRSFALLGAGMLAIIALAQEAPPSMFNDGVPAIPRELRERMNQYLNLRAATFADWDPARRSMLILTRFGETNQVHQVTLPGGSRRQLTFFPDRVLGARFSPRPGKNSFVFKMDTGGGEFFQYYRFDATDGSIHLLTDGKSRNDGLVLNRKGTLAAYVSTRRDGHDYDLYTIDPDKPNTAKKVLELAGAWTPGEWSPDDKRLLVFQEFSVNESYMHVWDVTSGQVEALTPAGKEKVSYGPAVWAKDGKGLYVVSDRNSEFRRLFYFELAAKRFTPLSENIPWDIEDLALSASGRVLAYTANADGISQLHLLDTGTRRELPAPRLPQGLVFNLSFHRQLNELALNINSAKSPSDVYSYNLDTQKLERWTFSETGGLNAETFQDESLIHFPTFDQTGGKPRAIAAFVTRPPARFKPPYAVLIDIHGGPEGQTRPGFQGRDNYFVNEMGLALIKPNVRGSTGYGKTFTNLDNGVLREDSVKDIGALLDWVARQPDLDSGRVAVTGGSYGGYMSLATITHYGDRLRCGIDVVGVSNFVALLERTESYRRDLRRVEYGDERDPKMREFLISISPTTSADKIKIPLLVAAGRNDPRVPYTLSEEIVNKVRSNGGKVWYVLARDEGHGYAKKPNTDYLAWAEVLFLEQFLLQ